MRDSILVWSFGLSAGPQSKLMASDTVYLMLDILVGTFGFAHSYTMNPGLPMNPEILYYFVITF